METDNISGDRTDVVDDVADVGIVDTGTSNLTGARTVGSEQGPDINTAANR